jgi:peptidoglycan/LPS O-acetylase OafA/YrhL
MEQIKKIAGLFFALSFFCMALLFVKSTTISEYRYHLKTAFLIFGALALAFNLISYNYSSKGNTLFNFLFWFGAILIFFGIIFKMFHYPFHTLLILAGLFISAFSFIISKFYKENKKNDSDLVDQL